MYCKGKAEYAVLLGSGIVLIYVCQNSSDVIMIKYFKHFTQILYGRIQDMNITKACSLCCGNHMDYLSLHSYKRKKAEVEVHSLTPKHPLEWNWQCLIIENLSVCFFYVQEILAEIFGNWFLP